MNSSSTRTLTVGLLMLAATGASPAQPAAMPCTALADAAARLACYDRWHGRPTEAAAPAAPPQVAPPAAQAGAAPQPSTHLSSRWDLDGQDSPRFAPRPYRPVYLLPATWTDRVNLQPSSPSPDHSVLDPLQLRPAETKFQISLKAKLGDGLLGSRASLWGGYTQSSRWQVYNGAASRPFRETNYEPELILVWPLQGQALGWQLRMGSLSVTHESNGRSLPLSRSWNRFIGTLAFERDDWVAEIRPWLRIREGRSDDDNPDIEDFVGRGELVLSRYWGNQALSLQLRHSLRDGERARGSAQIDWVFPLSGVLHGYLQVFSGHGESLIDYNQRQNKLGLGVTIAGWR